MRVPRALFVLLLLSIALSAGIGVYSASQNSSLGGETTTITLPNGQQRAIPAAIATQIAARGITFSDAAQVAQGGFPGGTAQNASVSTIAVLGTVEENRTAALTFETAGTVSEVFVRAGDYVEAGTVLARLDSTAAQIEYDQARLSLENAQINLQELLEPPTEDEIEAALLNITSAQASYSDAANSTDELQIQQQQMRYQQAVENYNLQVQIRANMSGTEQEIALQDAAVGEASFNVEVARLQLERLQTPDNSNLWSASVRVQIAQLQYDQLMAGTDESQIRNAQLNVDIAQANLESAETTLRQLELISPIAGVITAVNIEVGSTVTAATTAITMTDLSQLWLTAPIHELDLDQVTEGMTAEIVLDALPDETFTATIEEIAWIGEESDGIVQYNARFALYTNDLRIRPGMTGEATIRPTSAAS